MANIICSYKSLSDNGFSVVSVTNNKLCPTKNVIANTLYLNVSGTYSNNQLVALKDVSKKQKTYYYVYTGVNMQLSGTLSGKSLVFDFSKSTKYVDGNSSEFSTVSVYGKWSNMFGTPRSIAIVLTTKTADTLPTDAPYSSTAVNLIFGLSGGTTTLTTSSLSISHNGSKCSLRKYDSSHLETGFIHLVVSDTSKCYWTDNITQFQ